MRSPFITGGFISAAFMRVRTRCRAYVSRGSGNRRKTMKAYESEHCGWFHEGFGMGESMRATWQGDGNPICRHFCADIVRLFISTPNEIERKGQIKGQDGEKKRVRRREKESVSLYWHIAADPPTCSFFDLFYLRCTPRENGCTTPRCVSDTHRRRLAASPLCMPRISPVSMRRPVTTLPS